MAERIEAIADFGDICGEGPRWNSREQALYWTDLLRQRFYRYRWSDRKAEIVSEDLQVSAFAFNEPGGYVVTNVSGIYLWDAQSPPVLLANKADGQRCIMNDSVADPQGRVFSGSYFRNPESGEFERVGCLFRVDNNGSVRVVDEGFRLSNGLGFSPDFRTLYYVDSADRRIYAFDYEARDGSIRRKRVLVQVPMTEGFPDGLAVDTEGFLWCAHWFGECVIRYDPEGAIVRRIKMPASQIAGVTFGGPNFEDLFVTTAGKIDTLQLAQPGYDPLSNFTGGPVYHLKPGVQGRDHCLARITKAA